jgi:hypothetical protein
VTSLPVTPPNAQQLVVARRPAIYAVALYLFVTVGRLHELVPALEGTPVGKVVLALALGSLILARRPDSPKLEKGAIVKLVIAYSVLAGASVTYSVWGSHSFEIFTTSYIATAIMFYLILKTADSWDVIRFYLAILVVSAAALAYSTLSIWVGGRGSVGATYDPNDLAMVLVSVLPVALILLLLSGKWAKIGYGSMMAAILIGIGLTGSRGGFLGLLCVAVFLLFQKVPTRRGFARSRFSFSKVLVISAAVGVFMMLAPTIFWERMETMLNLESDYNMTAEDGRLALWSDGIEMMLRRPIGVGIGAFPAGQGMLIGGRYQTAHNSVIQVGGELGFAGILVFLLLYRAAWRAPSSGMVEGREEGEAIRIKGYALGLRAAILGCFVTSMFLSQAYAPLLFALAALSERARCLLAMRQAGPAREPSGEQQVFGSNRA